jgi:hypothetical protein
MKRLLRKEVHFGCPVDACGSPFLTYHHFDPPYRKGKKHIQLLALSASLKNHPRLARAGRVKEAKPRAAASWQSQRSP